MKILVLWPPHVPSYFNAGHHLPVYLTASYLRRHHPEATIDTADFGVLNVNWKEIGEQIYQGRYDLIVLVNDFDNVDGVPRLISYVRELSPHTKLLTGGRLSIEAPLALRGLELDAIVVGGDLEAGADAYVRALEDRRDGPLPGVSVRDAGRWCDGAPGVRIDAQDWSLPDVDEIPYPAYDRLYNRDQNKFCGVPGRRELVVPVARGCPVNCSFCDVPSVQGLRERRLPVDRTCEYIRDSFDRHPFEYVAFYAPTFTLDRRWTVDLCHQLASQGRNYPWKCATTVAHLDDELVRLMGESGCIRISVGVETFEANQNGLPRRKRFTAARLKALADVCTSSGIELNCFVVVGLPGTTVEGTRDTIDKIREVGARVRPTMYASPESLRTARSLEEAARFNRHILPFGAGSAESAADFYQFFFGVENWITQVSERIPHRIAPVVTGR